MAQPLWLREFYRGCACAPTPVFSRLRGVYDPPDPTSDHIDALPTEADSQEATEDLTTARFPVSVSGPVPGLLSALAGESPALAGWRGVWRSGAQVRVWDGVMDISGQRPLGEVHADLGHLQPNGQPGTELPEVDHSGAELPEVDLSAVQRRAAALIEAENDLDSLIGPPLQAFSRALQGLLLGQALLLQVELRAGPAELALSLGEELGLGTRALRGALHLLRDPQLSAALVTRLSGSEGFWSAAQAYAPVSSLPRWPEGRLMDLVERAAQTEQALGLLALDEATFELPEALRAAALREDWTQLMASLRAALVPPGAALALERRLGAARVLVGSAALAAAAARPGERQAPRQALLSGHERLVWLELGSGALPDVYGVSAAGPGALCALLAEAWTEWSLAAALKGERAALGEGAAQPELQAADLLQVLRGANLQTLALAVCRAERLTGWQTVPDQDRLALLA